MKNTKRIILAGYRVAGIDLRDDSAFEDFYVLEQGPEDEAFLVDMYGTRGYRIDTVELAKVVDTTIDLLTIYNVNIEPLKSAPPKPKEPKIDGRTKGHQKGARPPMWTGNSDQAKQVPGANKDEAVEKNRIVKGLEDLKRRRGREGLRQVIRRTGNKITESVLDGMIARDRHPFDKWLQVGTALDKVLADEAAEQEKAG